MPLFPNRLQHSWLARFWRKRKYRTFIYMTLGGLQADAKGMNNHMRAGIEYAIERMEAALIEALQSNKY